MDGHSSSIISFVGGLGWSDQFMGGSWWSNGERRRSGEKRYEVSMEPWVSSLSLSLSLSLSPLASRYVM